MAQHQDPTQKYEMNIVLTVKKVGDSTPMAITTQQYNNMDYEDTVYVQKAVVDGLIGCGLEAIKLKK